MKYRTEEGTIINTANAKSHWDEATRWNGNNHISVNTGSQWDHETLYESAKGRFYIESDSQWQGSFPSIRFVDQEEAVAWLLLNNKEIPERLKHIEEEVSE